MNAVFVLAYRTDWEYAERYSLVSGLILLFINVLIFIFIYGWQMIYGYGG